MPDDPNDLISGILFNGFAESRGSDEKRSRPPSVEESSKCQKCRTGVGEDGKRCMWGEVEECRCVK